MAWAASLLGPTLLVKSGRAMVAKPTDEVLAGKKRVLLYFSASWCPPCKKFTPILATCYDDAREADEGSVEVVYIGSDFDEPSFTAYFGSMPWASLPWGAASTALAQELGTTFGVRGIPSLVALSGADGGVVTTDARAIVQREQSLDGLGSMPAGAPAVRGRRAPAPPGEGGPSLVGLLLDLLSCGLASALCARPRGGGAAKAAAAAPAAAAGLDGKTQ
jgi:nucleoredoxin